ncbi:NAD(P)-binding domain-containing protein [Streptomyces sp. SID13031]|uniref:NADPH-dependent F420 reductase n=1 Tax=Streptomyces sp. SID13031 TaxID=2706046 RepID=UPI0013CBBEA2|nr:NAD(P)-binding domain-containing protein [Streptomyces sp. SID13031]NEA32397.1 NAD(P)-binding domain-containing protein [Streptomyces sp. SID13031]
MRIGILGNGLMAKALGGQWVRAGHEVLAGGRREAPATLLEASEFGDVTLLAVRAEAVEEVLTGVGAATGRFAERTLIDCTNAVVPGEFVLAVPAIAEKVADLAVGAHVVKAFNLAADAVWRDAPHSFEGEPLGVPYCGDHPAANERVAELIRALGCTPVAAGGLVRARLLEATAALAIGLWVDGADTRSLFPPIAAAFGTVHP